MTNYNARWISRDELEKMPFCAIGENVLIDTSVRIVHIENLTLGDNVRIDAGTLIVGSGPIRIGSWVHIGANCYIEGRGGVKVGDFANISSFVGIHSVSDDASGSSLTNPMTPERYKTLQQAEVIIGRHSIIFTKSTVLPGTVVGDGAVVGAHSLAAKDIQAWTVYAGIPARRIKARKKDVLNLEQDMRNNDESSRN